MSAVFRISLDGGQEVPSVETPYNGIGTAIYNSKNDTVSYSINFNGLDFGAFIGQPSTVETDDDVTAAHFHNADRGANGDIVFDWLGDGEFEVISTGNHKWMVVGTWERGEAGGLLAMYAGMLDAGRPGEEIPLYANIHTVGNPDGEIRGQFVGLSNDKSNAVLGTAEDDTLWGLGGDDTVEGLAGDDVIDGGKGRDTVTGGLGDDAFVFSTKLKPSNVDVIADFSDGDRIYLDHKIFKKLKLGELDDKYYHKGRHAEDKNDHIIYDPRKNKIKYDKDGSGRAQEYSFAEPGGPNKIAAPGVGKGVHLSAEDFFVV